MSFDNFLCNGLPIEQKLVLWGAIIGIAWGCYTIGKLIERKKGIKWNNGFIELPLKICQERFIYCGEIKEIAKVIKEKHRNRIGFIEVYLDKKTKVKQGAKK